MKLEKIYGNFTIVGKDGKQNVQNVSLGRLIDTNRVILPAYHWFFAYPTEKPLEKCFFNMWRGFQGKRAEYNVKEIEPFLSFVKDIICAKDEANYAYLIKWLSFLVKYPCRKSGQAIVLMSAQGTGKNVFTDFIANYVIGQHASVPNVVGIDQLLSNNNFYLLAKRFIVINELASIKSSFKSDFDKLKSFITDENLMIKKLYSDIYSTPSFCECIFVSNNRDAMSVEEGDRRYFMMEVSKEKMQDKKYFKALTQVICNQDFGNKVYSYLMDYESEDFMEMSMPQTDLKREAILMSARGVNYFVYKQIENIKLQLSEAVSKEEKQSILDANNFTSIDVKFQEYINFCLAEKEEPVTKRKFESQFKHHRVEVGSGKNRYYKLAF